LRNNLTNEGLKMYATMTELDRHEAYGIGEANRDSCWVLTGADVWHRNPYYTGPNEPHPENYDYDEE
jgi:hypothetical protein